MKPNCPKCETPTQMEPLVRTKPGGDCEFEQIGWCCPRCNGDFLTETALRQIESEPWGPVLAFHSDTYI